jgi:zinc protease
MNVLPLVLGMALEASASVPKVPVEQYQLDNGLTVLLSEDHALPVVSVEVLYLVGSGHERSGRTGFAHLFEHLMFQGSEHFDQEYFKPYEPIGAQVNGTTSRDRTNFFEVVPSNYLETPLWMESDRMQWLLPALTQEKLDNQREVVKNERRQRNENAPYGMSQWYLSEMLYPPGHPYRHMPIGSHEDLSAATLDDVKAFFQQYYVPANAALAVVGDFQSADVRQLIQRYFGSIPGGQRAPHPAAQLPTPSPAHWQKPDDVPLPRIYLAWHTPALFAPGDAELDLLSNVLTGGKSSRLYYPLVYDKKIAKDVDAYQVSQQLSSYYVVEATAAPGQTVDALYAEIEKAMAKALEAPPTAGELERAISAYKKQFYGRIEAVQSRASTLTGYYQHTGRADYLGDDIERYATATPERVHAAGRQYLNVSQAVRLDILPGKKEQPAAPEAKQPPAVSAQPPTPAAKPPASAPKAAEASKGPGASKSPPASSQQPAPQPAPQQPAPQMAPAPTAPSRTGGVK